MSVNAGPRPTSALIICAVCLRLESRRRRMSRAKTGPNAAARTGDHVLHEKMMDAVVIFQSPIAHSPSGTTMRAFILLTLFPAAAGLAYATSLSTENYVRYYAATDSRYSFACRNGNGVACGGQTTVPGTGWILDYHSNSQSTFGLLAGQASAHLSGLDNGVAPPTFISVGGRANYIETTTVTGGTGTGTETMRFHVTGTSSNSSGNSARAQLQLIPIDAQGHFGTEQNFGVDSSGNAFIPISFTFGVAFSTRSASIVWLRSFAMSPAHTPSRISRTRWCSIRLESLIIPVRG